MSTQSKSLLGSLVTFDRIFMLSRIGLHLLILAIVLPPVIFALSMSIRPTTEWYSTFAIIPSEIKLEWYVQSFEELRPALMNSYLRGLGTAIIGLVACVPSAYAFSREEFPGRESSFYWIIGVQLFPPIIVVVPILVAYLRLGLNDTIVGLWIVDMIFVIPFGVWVLRDFFSNLSTSLEDAARVYGCSKFSAFVRVILPLTMPAMLAVGFLAFIRGWNEFLFAQLLTSDKATVGIIQLVEATGEHSNKHWGRIMAKTIIISVPPAVMYLIARRSIEDAFSFD